MKRDMQPYVGMDWCFKCKKMTTHRIEGYFDVDKPILSYATCIVWVRFVIPNHIKKECLECGYVSEFDNEETQSKRSLV